MTRFVLALVAACLGAVAIAPAYAGADDPLVFVFQKQKDPVAIKDRAEEVAKFLSAEVGRPVEAFVPTDYSATVQALVSKRADFAYVSAIPFLLARRDGGATILLAENREDAGGQKRTSYDSVFVVREDSPIESLSDIARDPKRVRVCFTSTTSTSGYVMAYARLVKEGVLRPKQDPHDVFASVSFGGGYTQALEQVLAGRADVCAVSYYTVEGPTADVYLPAEKREKLRIIARTPEVPTHVVCARGGMDAATRERMKAALLKLAREKPDLLASVYGAAELVEVDEEKHVAAAVQALEHLGMPIENFAK